VRFDHRAHGGSPVAPVPYEIADLGRDVLGLTGARHEVVSPAAHNAVVERAEEINRLILTHLG
jgi:pimeloyl-ACP methyl ester carboxylesterase